MAAWSSWLYSRIDWNSGDIMTAIVEFSVDVAAWLIDWKIGDTVTAVALFSVEYSWLRDRIDWNIGDIVTAMA